MSYFYTVLSVFGFLALPLAKLVVWWKGSNADTPLKEAKHNEEVFAAPEHPVSDVMRDLRKHEGS